MWWLRYFWLRLMFILTLVNIMTCVGAWYAVSSSYSNPKHRLVMVPYKNYIEVSKFCRNCEVCYALGGLVRSTNMNNLDYCRSTTLKSKRHVGFRVESPLVQTFAIPEELNGITIVFIIDSQENDVLLFSLFEVGFL